MFHLEPIKRRIGKFTNEITVKKSMVFSTELFKLLQLILKTFRV